jgi:hypothetical protein
MSDDNPISKWRAAGQQHPAAPDKARTDSRSPRSTPKCHRHGGRLGAEEGPPMLTDPDRAGARGRVQRVASWRVRPRRQTPPRWS